MSEQMPSVLGLLVVQLHGNAVIKAENMVGMNRSTFTPTRPVTASSLSETDNSNHTINYGPAEADRYDHDRVVAFAVVGTFMSVLFVLLAIAGAYIYIIKRTCFIKKKTKRVPQSLLCSVRPQTTAAAETQASRQEDYSVQVYVSSNTHHQLQHRQATCCATYSQ